MGARAWPGQAVVLIAALLCVPAALAQQTLTSATIAGTVVDPGGASVAGASLRLVNRQTNHATVAASDDRGRFRFLAAVGDYELTATAQGFGATTIALNLRVGAAVDVRVRLAVAAAESVTVSGETPLVDAARTNISESILPTDIDALPLNGRNYLDLALLAPNVSRTTTRSSERFAETSAVPGTGISVAGQRNLSNTIIVDGLSANDDAADLAGTSFAEEVIRELQVITTGATAEFGRASAGVLNIVTQSGTNRLMGRGYGFFRSARWDARNAFATRKDPLDQVQFGATAGGPVVPGRSFFFLNVERADQEKNGVVTIPAERVNAMNSVLAATGYPGPQVTTGEFLPGYESTNVFGRFDQRLEGDSRVQIRYSRYGVNSENARSVGGLNAVTRGTSLTNVDQTVAAGWQASAGGATLNDLRAQWTRSNLAAPANDPVGPAVTIAGVASFGTSASSPTARSLSTIQLSDTLALQRGAHLVRTGLDLLYNQVTIEFPGALQGTYSFTSLANFERGVYQQYQQAFGEVSLSQSNPNLGLFVQDEWSVHPSVTVNAGVRYDLQWLPDPVSLDTNNIAPRIGVAWAGPDRRLVVRGSAGVYFDRIPLRATSNALQRNGERYRTAVLTFGEPGAPVFPNVLTAFPSQILSAITTIDPGIRNGRSEQTGIEVERALGERMSVAAGYSHVRGHQIIMSRNVNVPTLTAAQASALGIPNLGRPNPAFGNISRYESIGDAWFDALTLAVHARPAAWGTLRLAYTFSRALDTAGNAFFNTPQDNSDIAAEKGPSDNDQRHRLVLSGVLRGGAGSSGWTTFGGLELGYVVTVASGVPFNVVAGSDLNNDTTNNDRPAGVSRNSARQPSTSSVDLRLSRSFAIGGRQRLQLLAEAFNLLNHVNVLQVNNTYGTGTLPLAAFGQPTAAGDARQIQLGVRWSF